MCVSVCVYVCINKYIYVISQFKKAIKPEITF